MGAELRRWRGPPGETGSQNAGERYAWNLARNAVQSLSPRAHHGIRKTRHDIAAKTGEDLDMIYNSTRLWVYPVLRTHPAQKKTAPWRSGRWRTTLAEFSGRVRQGVQGPGDSRV